MNNSLVCWREDVTFYSLMSRVSLDETHRKIICNLILSESAHYYFCGEAIIFLY